MAHNGLLQKPSNHQPALNKASSPAGGDNKRGGCAKLRGFDACGTRPEEKVDRRRAERREELWGTREKHARVALPAQLIKVIY